MAFLNGFFGSGVGAEPGVFRPEMFGAGGRGLTEDSVSVQACVDAAEAIEGSIIRLHPRKIYAVENSVIIGGGAYSARVEGKAFTNFPGSTTHFTFQKQANVPAIIVPTGSSVRPFLSSIGVKGLGDPDPSLTDTGVDGTPGILIQSRCNGDKIVLFQTGGMSGYGEEGETIGSALCILQREGEENVNGCTFTNIVAVNCRGGVYIGKVSSGVTNGKNMNAVRVQINRAYNIIGYVVNADGWRNEIDVQNCYAPSCTAQVRLRGDNCIVRSYYNEQNTPVGCDFLGGAKNVFVTADSSKYTTLYLNLGNNTVDCPQTQTVTLGSPTGGYSPAFYGAAGLQVDSLSFPNTLANGYTKIKEAAYADYGTAIDIVSSAAQGTVTKGGTWTARFAKVGVNTLITLNLAGTVNVASANSSRLTINSTTTGMAFENMGNLGGALCALYLTNNVVTNKPVFLAFKSTTALEFRDATGAAMTFNDVVGAGAFTLSGTIMVMDAGGMV